VFKIVQYALINKRLNFSLIGVVISIHIIFQCTLALYQIKTGIAYVDPDYRFLGTMTHANIFSECILFSLPFIFIGLIKIRGPWKYLPVTALFLSILLIIVAETRAVWIGIAFSFFVAIFFIYKNKHFTHFTSTITFNYKVILASAMFLVSVFLLFVKAEGPHIFAHLISLIRLDSSGRFDLWLKTTSIIGSHFVVGVGPGNWRFHIPILNHISQQRPHNDFLWVFAESGIFAFIAFVSIFSYTLFRIIKCLKTIEKNSLPTAYALLFGIIAYCIDSFFAFPKERPYLLILLALQFAFVHSLIPDKTIFKINNSIFVAFSIVFTIFVSWFCWNRMQGEITNKRIIEHVYLSPSEKMSMLKSIDPFFYSADPFSTPIKSLEGSLWVDLSNFENAKKCYIDAYKMAPLNPDICNNIGSISEMTSDRATARTFYNKAITIDSLNAQALLNLAVIEYKDGDKEKATELVKKVDTNSIAGQENLMTQYAILKSSLRF
jgi:O-antigen ligase